MGEGGKGIVKTAKELLDVCDARAREANILYEEKYYHTTIYLLSYAVECVMKARIRQLSGSYPEIHSLKQLREKCGIAASVFGSQWQADFLAREQHWVDMRYEVDQFSDWDDDRKKKYYQAGGKLIAFFKKQMV